MSATHNSKHAAARLVAHALGHGERALWREVYSYAGLRDPDEPDERR